MLQKPGEYTHQLQEGKHLSPAKSLQCSLLTKLNSMPADKKKKKNFSGSIFIFTEQAIEGEFGPDPIANNHNKFQ